MIGRPTESNHLATSALSARRAGDEEADLATEALAHLVQHQLVGERVLAREQAAGLLAAGAHVRDLAPTPTAQSKSFSLTPPSACIISLIRP